MKRALVITALLSIALPGIAQAQAPARAQQQKPAAKPAAKPAPSAAAQVADAKPARKPRRGDARHCLEQPSNTAIIKCAEAYL
jgi:hypothetical protein